MSWSLTVDRAPAAEVIEKIEAHTAEHLDSCPPEKEVYEAAKALAVMEIRSWPNPQAASVQAWGSLSGPLHVDVQALALPTHTVGQ